MSCGIYKITNLINGHSYIGMSKDIEKRIKEHFSHGLNGQRKDDLEKPLYKAFKKYGLKAFDWEILEECEESELKEREIYWIAYYNTYKDRQHYNETPGGDMPGKNTVHLGSEHGMAKLAEEDVIFCRKAYQKGKRSRNIYDKYFKDKITWSGFLRMWHGKSWKHIMPEVFEHNPHRAKYDKADCVEITKRFQQSGLSLSAFCKTDECYVGYGTLYKMIHEPEFYDNK